MVRFLQPWWLLTLLPVLALAAGYGWRQLRRTGTAARFTNLELLRTVVPRGLGWRRHLAAGAFLAGLALLGGALAQPSMQRQQPLERATVMLAIDVSLSMDANDVAPTRLIAAQQAAQRFARELPPSYNLGLVSFARTAQVLVPPSKDRDAVQRALAQLVLAEATATGEAVFAALDAIRSVPDDGAAGVPPARILLLSDGYRTYGRPLGEAAMAAAQADVPVSTIAFGTDHGVVDIGGYLQRVPVDRVALAGLAEGTGGHYYEAASADELKQVYQDLGSSLGHRQVWRDVSRWFGAGSLLLAMLAGVFSLLWTPRLI